MPSVVRWSSVTHPNVYQRPTALMAYATPVLLASLENVRIALMEIINPAPSARPALISYAVRGSAMRIISADPHRPVRRCPLLWVVTPGRPRSVLHQPPGDWVRVVVSPQQAWAVCPAASVAVYP